MNKDMFDALDYDISVGILWRVATELSEEKDPVKVEALLKQAESTIQELRRMPRR